MDFSLTKEFGTYALLLRATTYQIIRIGRLGELNIQPGTYIYVGSAFGPGGLAARVGRHLRREKTLRWHIDYLRAVCEVEEVWWTCDPVRRECEWANKLRELPGVVVPMPGFGSSDCGCKSHLVWVSTTANLAFGEDTIRYIRKNLGWQQEKASSQNTSV